MSNAHIDLVDYAGGLLTAQRHAIVTSAVVNGMGVYHGCEATIKGTNKIHLQPGFLTIYGRMVEVFEQDFTVTLASSGTKKGRLYCVIDLANTDNPCDILVETGTTLSDLPDHPDMNYNFGKSAFEICNFTVGVSQISALNYTAKNMSQSYASIYDFDSSVQTDNNTGFACLPGGIHMEWGKVDAVMANNNVMMIKVYWQKAFTYPPVVTANIDRTTNVALEISENVKIRDITATSAIICVHNTQGGYKSGWLRHVNFFAIGK
jgi:hypothetical protein